MTPFPALHTSANQDADDHMAAARKLAHDADIWLAELDAVLGDAAVGYDGEASVLAPRGRRRLLSA